jgi:hypothetical protein
VSLFLCRNTGFTNSGFNGQALLGLAMMLPLERRRVSRTAKAPWLAGTEQAIS